MGKGIQSPTECTCCQDMEFDGHYKDCPCYTESSNNEYKIKTKEFMNRIIVVDDFNQPLICYGCSHSAAYMMYTNGDLVEGTDFPGKPSGERPCFFCIRNAEREKWQTEFKETNGNNLECWYDGSLPIKTPMDCYHSVDMLNQFNEWTK